MNTYVVAGTNISAYLPKNLSEGSREKIWKIAQDIAERIEQNLSLGFRYNGTTRLIVPASLYLQEQTSMVAKSITRGAKRTPLPKRGGARKALGVDGIEIARQIGAAGGWKSFHLDQIDDLQILSDSEIENAFPKTEQAQIDSLIHAEFPRKGGFVRNWNHWFRTPIVEAASNQDLLK